MATLSRKYRPQNFKEVVGQNHIKITLQNEIQKDKIAHAYLFCGPRAVGKTTFARVFSKAINCINRKDDNFEPCNKCEVCNDITVGKSLDVIEIDAASHTGVDNVRENIIAQARVAPSRCKYKVFIVDEIHMLSISAFNALLKVIEEPPVNVVFILCTTEVHKVPATIISRCQRFDFKRIGITDMVKKLNYIIKQEDLEVEKNILESIARHADGYMRDAESLLGQVVSIGGKKITVEDAQLVIPRSDLAEVVNLIEALSKKDTSSSIGLINKLVDDGVDIKIFTKELVEVLRKILFQKISPDLNERLSLEFGEGLELKINQVAKNLSEAGLVQMLDKFVIANQKIKTSFISQLPVEIAIIELCSANTQKNISEPAKPAVTAPSPVSTAPNPSVPQNQPSATLKKDIPAPAPVVKNVNVNFNITDITAKWSEVLYKIKQSNHSLSFILRACQPKDIKGNQLCLAFKYKFHKDRINDVQVKIMIENVLNEVYGTQLFIESLIDENLDINGTGQPASQPASAPEINSESETAPAQPSDTNNDMMNNFLNTFGGKVVN